MHTTAIRRGILLSLAFAATLAVAACNAGQPASTAAPGSENPVTATATPTIPAQPAGSQNGVPDCLDTGILVSSQTGGGYAGHQALLLTFANQSGHTCYLQGFPVVSLADTAGSVLLGADDNLDGSIGGAVATARGLSLTAPPRVVLTPGSLAEAVLEWEDVNPIQGVPGGCRVPDSAAILVTPPGSTRASRLAGLTDVCDALQIGPVIPAASG